MEFTSEAAMVAVAVGILTRPLLTGPQPSGGGDADPMYKSSPHQQIQSLAVPRATIFANKLRMSGVANQSSHILNELPAAVPAHLSKTSNGHCSVPCIALGDFP